MVRYTLELDFAIEEPAEFKCEGCIRREFQMPALPHLGEKIMIGEDEIEVRLIVHHLEEGRIEVECDPPFVTTAQAYLTQTELWQIQMYSGTKDESKFLQAVQGYK